MSDSQLSIRQRSAPGPDLKSLLRSLPGLRSNPLNFIQAAADQYGDIVQFKIGGLHTVMLNHPDYIQYVLQDNNKNYSKDTVQYNALVAVTGRGLLTSDGEPWLRQRRLMQPAFHRQQIHDFGPLMAAAAAKMITAWESYAVSGQVLDIDQAMMRLALEILGKALLGVDLSSEAPELTGAVVTVLDTIVAQVKSPPAVPGFIPTAANRRFKAAMRTLDRAVLEIIDGHRQAGEGATDLLGLLMRVKDKTGHASMDARQLRDEVITILIAGHETVASALTWACCLISQNPDAAHLLQEELRQVLNGRPPCVEDLPALVYTRQLFDETLRLYPPAWLITRKCLSEDQVGGFRIPKNALVVIGISAMHRNPAYWENPERFDPLRFAPEAVANRPRYAYLPFGGGPRLCIGSNFALVEAPLILASIFQRYQLELEPGAEVAPEALVTLRPRAGLPMRIHRI